MRKFAFNSEQPRELLSRLQPLSLVISWHMKANLPDLFLIGIYAIHMDLALTEKPKVHSSHISNYHTTSPKDKELITGLVLICSEHFI